ncbi:hypothetical protein Naga_100014g44 [Nannochloropsis gaditana]|uniref:Uncharacterized protein n=1 Tax=Nannochloropsis gaditana TaxID=72520 RepID=W7TRF7_9STRA|nr:hypothetical protein Naga_100014g44 [Nannochloropsis gaditana]
MVPGTRGQIEHGEGGECHTREAPATGDSEAEAEKKDAESREEGRVGEPVAWENVEPGERAGLQVAVEGAEGPGHEHYAQGHGPAGGHSEGVKESAVHIVQEEEAHQGPVGDAPGRSLKPSKLGVDERSPSAGLRVPAVWSWAHHEDKCSTKARGQHDEGQARVKQCFIRNTHCEPSFLYTETYDISFKMYIMISFGSLEGMKMHYKAWQLQEYFRSRTARLVCHVMYECF